MHWLQSGFEKFSNVFGYNYSLCALVQGTPTVYGCVRFRFEREVQESMPNTHGLFVRICFIFVSFSNKVGYFVLFWYNFFCHNTRRYTFFFLYTILYFEFILVELFSEFTLICTLFRFHWIAIWTKSYRNFYLIVVVSFVCNDNDNGKLM